MTAKTREKTYYRHLHSAAALVEGEEGVVGVEEGLEEGEDPPWRIASGKSQRASRCEDQVGMDIQQQELGGGIGWQLG